MEGKRRVELSLSSVMAIQSVAILLYGKLTDREISVLVALIKMFNGLPDFMVNNNVRNDIAILTDCSSSQVANILSSLTKKEVIINGTRGFYKFDDLLIMAFDGIDFEKDCALTFKVNNDE